MPRVRQNNLFFIKLNPDNMLIDFSTIAPTFFVASISAAGLVFAAGNVVISSLTTIIQRMETVDCPQEWPNINALYKLSIESLKKSQRDISWQITISVVLFLSCNIFVIAYWIFDNMALLFKIAIALYIISLVFMVFIVTMAPDVWKLMNNIPLLKK
jgi:hypothetical protein